MAMTDNPEKDPDKWVSGQDPMTGAQASYLRTLAEQAHEPDPTETQLTVLHEAGAIRECEAHGWMQDRADPHARDRALDIARQYPLAGMSPEAAAVAIAEILDSIGDTCPECSPEP
jgi:DUF3072 family protein